MTLKIYNSLTRKKEIFKPVEKNSVKMYVCGMTVYSDAHIGHARTYLAFDIIRRYFEYKNFKVTYVQNITDVDDKIIKAAKKEGIDALKYSSRFTEICLNDLDLLGIRRADIYPKASETISDMIDMIKQIIDNGYGYESEGDVYFSIEKFKDYGKLSGQNIDEMKAGVRIDLDDKKKNPLDFALWKKSKPDEPAWDSPWGLGRPGWHIECSAMSSKYLGLPFDIHGGGMDLRFPHHENEIAQAQAAKSKGFAKYWMHIGLLTVDGEKMSKSIGNIVNIRDILHSWDAEVIRMFFAQAHYRSPPDFNEKALVDVKKGLDRLYRLKERLDILCEDCLNISIDEKKLNDNEQIYFQKINDFKSEFENAMDDDFNTPKAFSILFEFVNFTNRFLEKNKIVDSCLCRYSLDIFIQMGNVLTLFESKDKDYDNEILNSLKLLISKYKISIESDTVDEIISKLLDVREDARKNKNWNIADEIRNDLDEVGFEIQDTDSGPVWRKK